MDISVKFFYIDSVSKLNLIYITSFLIFTFCQAQAIMLLAGNGSAPNQNKTVSTAKLQPAISIPSKDDGFIMSQSYPSTLPSPLPVTTLAGSQPGGGSSSNNEISIIRPVGPSTTPTNHLESPKVVASVGSATEKKVQTGIYVPGLYFLLLCISSTTLCKAL